MKASQPPAGREKWQKRTVESILLNEKYKGEALLQKAFTVDFLTKKVKKNEGEVPQYYVKNSHPGIIDPAEWQLVRDEMKRRKSKEGYHHGLSPFAGKIFCGECGSVSGPKVWHSNDPYRKVIWRCNEKYGRKGKNVEAGAQRCSTPHLTEDEIKEAFCRALGELIEEREKLAEDIRLLRAELADTEGLERKAVILTAELKAINTQIAVLIQKNAATAQDQAVYDQKYNELAGRYQKDQKKLDTVNRESKGEKERLAHWTLLNESCERLTLCPCHSLLLAGMPWWKGWMYWLTDGWCFTLFAGGRLWCDKNSARCVFLSSGRQQRAVFLVISEILCKVQTVM